MLIYERDKFTAQTQPKEESMTSKLRSIVLAAAILVLAGAYIYPAHAASAAPATGDEWSCRNQYRIKASSKSALTLAVKQHLTIADRLLKSRVPEDRIKGLGVVLAAAVCASERIGDHTLAINITERYLLPGRKQAAESPWEYMNKERLTITALNIYEKAGKSAKVIEVGKAWTEANPGGATADTIRAKVAKAYIKTGKKSQAIQELKKISDTSNMSGAKLWLAETTPRAPITKNTNTESLSNIFTNMPGATILDITEDGASRLTNGSSKYASLPIRVPFAARFGGGITAKSEGVQLAITSDSPVKIYINGEIAYQTQNTPIKSKAAPGRKAPATTGTQTIPIELEEGELTDVQVEYTKTSTESGGITLFAYGGEAELTAPQMGPAGVSGSSGIIKPQYQLTFTGPKSGPLPSVSLKSKEDADSLHTCNWHDHGYGTRTDSRSNGTLTCTWTWDWDTLSEHNGSHTLEYTVHWPGGTTTDTDSTTIQNATISNMNPRPATVGTSGSTTITATCENNNLTNVSSTLNLSTITNNGANPTVPAGTYSWNLAGTQQTQGIYSYDVTITGQAPKPEGYTGSCTDSITYRSKYLSTSINVSYVDTDDNSTPDDTSDDKYNYNISYSISDSKERDASTGYITIYGPDGSVKQTISGIDVSLGSHSTTYQMPANSTAGKCIAVLFAADNDGPEYRDHQNRWAYERGAVFSPYDVQVTYCPAYFVPGHTNTVKYHIYPDAYTAPYTKLEIFRRDAGGNVTGSAIYTSINLSGEGGTEQSVVYSGEEIAYTPDFDPGRYIARISIGNSSTECIYDQKPFEVKAWSLLGLFWDDLTDKEKSQIDEADAESDPDYWDAWDSLCFDGEGIRPAYCAGIDLSTVTASRVAVTEWYWDENASIGNALSIAAGTATEGISYADWENIWGQLIQDKAWYDERGSAITWLGGVFYSMSETDQYFYIKLLISDTGVLDNAGNLFDANTDTQQREATIIYQLKIDGDGSLTIIDEVRQ
jgi:hypothetical protein